MPRYGTCGSRARNWIGLRSCPRCRARRSRRAPGSRRRRRGSPCRASRRSVASMNSMLDARARPHAARGVSASVSEMYESLQVHVLADHRDRDRRSGLVLASTTTWCHSRQVGRRHVEPQLVDDDVVEALLVQQHRDLVDVVGVDGRDHGALLDVREQRDLARAARAATCSATRHSGHVRLDADRAQLLAPSAASAWS